MERDAAGVAVFVKYDGEHFHEGGDAGGLGGSGGAPPSSMISSHLPFSLPPFGAHPSLGGGGGGSHLPAAAAPHAGLGAGGGNGGGRAASSRKRKPRKVDSDYDSDRDGRDSREDGGDDDDDDGAPAPARQRKRARAAASDDAPAPAPAPGGFGTDPDSVRVISVVSSEDVLDDGWRWRKYGQKHVRGSAHPRSYYKCTTLNCPMRKHCERSTSDSAVVVSTYEGTHDHGQPPPATARANAPPRASSAELRAAAGATSAPGVPPGRHGAVRDSAPAGAPRARAHHPAPSPPRGASAAAAAAAASASAASAAAAAAARTSFRPPPRLVLPMGDEHATLALGLPSVGPITAMGSMPLSAVLAGADDDMLAATMTLLDSAKGPGGPGKSFPRRSSVDPLPDAVGPPSALPTGHHMWTPTPGAAMEAVRSRFAQRFD